ncbi:MAG: GAF domain-containing protein, partial [Geodermatophilaceae bacterium]
MQARMGARSRHQLAILGGVSLIGAGVLWNVGLIPYHVQGSPLSWLAFLLAFVWVESTQLHIEVRRQTFSVSLSELCLVLGIFLIGPLPTLITRLLGNAVLMLARRAAVEKLLLNSCIFALECSIAPVVIFAVGSPDVTQSTTWIAVFVAIVTVDLVSGSLVALAIASTQGWPSTQQLARMNVVLLAVGAFNAAVALVVLILIQGNGAATVLLLLLGGILLLAFRGYAKSVQQHRTLGQVYDFAKTVEESTIAVRGGHQALEAVREMLNARSAAIWLVATDDAPVRVLFADSETSESGYEGPDDPEDALRRRVMLDDAGVLFDRRTASPDELAALRVRGAEQAIGVPLSSASGAVGYLEVCDRLGDRLAFSSEDIELMGSLATHVSAASQNSQLLAKLSYDASHDPLTGL